MNATWQATELLQALGSPRSSTQLSASSPSSPASQPSGTARPGQGGTWYAGRCVETSAAAASFSGLQELLAALEVIMGGGQLAAGENADPELMVSLVSSPLSC